MFSVVFDRVPMAQGKWPKNFPIRENKGNLEILSKHRENTGNFVKTRGFFLLKL